MSKTNYEVFKKRAIAAQPIATKCSLADIDIVDESTIVYKGYPLNITRSFLKDLAKILGIPTRFVNEFEKLIGSNAKDKFLNFIKDAKAAKGSDEITLIGNPETKTIIGVTRNDYMPFETYFQVLEDMMNAQPFDIEDMTFTGNKVAVSAVLKKNVFNVSGLDAERFYPGFTFSNGIGAAGGSFGGGVDSYIYRLICGNGMSGASDGGSIIFGGPKGNESTDIFFRGVEHLTKNNFVPDSFHSNVGRATSTKASLNEVKNAASVLMKGSDLTKDFIDHYIPVNIIKSDLARRGVDFSTLNTMQEKSIKTNLTIWDVINGLTDFASHDYGFNLDPSHKLQIQKIAFDTLFKKNFDTENIININL